MPALEVEMVKKLGRDIAQGVQYLHRRGFLHRDIKPPNILVTEEGAKLGDLGLAVHVGEIEGWAGTPSYMAPEVRKMEEYGLPADIYSFGVLLHEALSGMRPYRSQSEL